MKRFILRLALFFLIVILFMIIGDYVISNGLRKTRYNEFAEWNDIFNGAINADVIINGSSRASVQLDPRIVDSTLNTDSYNLGMDGHGFFLQNCRYQTYIKFNRRPKIIIQVLGIKTLVKGDDLFLHEQFLPYLQDSLIAVTLKEYNRYQMMDYSIPFIRYYRQPHLIALGVLEFFNLYHKAANGKYKGYAGQALTWDNSFDVFIKNNPSGERIRIHKKSLAVFEDFLRANRENKTSVFMVYTPEYKPVHQYIINRDSIMGIYKNLAVKYNTPFLDYSDDPISSQKELFYNSQHLNKKGAEKFSRQLSMDLKKLITLPESN